MPAPLWVPSDLHVEEREALIFFSAFWNRDRLAPCIDTKKKNTNIFLCTFLVTKVSFVYKNNNIYFFSFQFFSFFNLPHPLSERKYIKTGNIHFFSILFRFWRYLWFCKIIIFTISNNYFRELDSRSFSIFSIFSPVLKGHLLPDGKEKKNTWSQYVSGYNDVFWFKMSIFLTG